MFALGCRMCKTHFLTVVEKCVAMVTAYYGKNGGKILRRELLPQFFTNSHEIWHRCLPWGVDVQDTFFDSGRKCVAMVTAYYTVKKYCGAGVLITFSDISSFCHCYYLYTEYYLFPYTFSQLYVMHDNIYLICFKILNYLDSIYTQISYLHSCTINIYASSHFNHVSNFVIHLQC